MPFTARSIIPAPSVTPGMRLARATGAPCAKPRIRADRSMRIDRIFRQSLLRAAGNRRHHCPECGGVTFSDHDEEWGYFGSRHCTECDWEENRRGVPPSPREINGDPRLPLLGYELTAQLLMVEQSGDVYSPFQPEQIARCEKLSALGYLVPHQDENDMPYFMPAPPPD